MFLIIHNKNLVGQFATLQEAINQAKNMKSVLVDGDILFIAQIIKQATVTVNIEVV